MDNINDTLWVTAAVRMGCGSRRALMRRALMRRALMRRVWSRRRVWKQAGSGRPAIETAGNSTLPPHLSWRADTCAMFLSVPQAKPH